MTILAETLEHLESQAAVAGKAVRAVHLGSYFTVVELDDSSVGACMTCYRLPAPRMREVQAWATAALAEDPLLLGWLFARGEAPPSWPVPPDQEPLLRHALGTAVISALSAPLLRAGGDATFAAASSEPPGVLAGARRAVVVGFGGLMERLALATDVAELHVSDLCYGAQRAEMDARVADYRRRCPRKRITISDGHDTASRMLDADMVVITGSALSNGTLETLLKAAERCPRIVVQGQSAGIHPKALFERRVDLVMTTSKPPELARLAALDASTDALRPVLEGGLPWLYLYPRQPRRRTMQP